MLFNNRKKYSLNETRVEYRSSGNHTAISLEVFVFLIIQRNDVSGKDEHQILLQNVVPTL